MESRQQSGYPATLLVGNLWGGEERAPTATTFVSTNPADRADVVTIAPQSTVEEVAQAAGANGAAVDDDGRPVDACRGHDGARHVLVAARE